MRQPIFCFLLLVILAGCAASTPSPALSPTQTPTSTPNPTQTPYPTNTPTITAEPTHTPTSIKTPTQDPNFIPKFVDTNYIELEKIWMISLFRSSEGHDFSDTFESCRSMKHYFKPYEHVDWSKVRIFAPVDGTVINIHEEWAGTQIEIRSNHQPNYSFVIFHLHLNTKIIEGSQVTEGMEIGTHVGKVTHSDIAVFNNSSIGNRLVSYFDVMTDDLFSQYQIRGVQNRSDLIISRSQRDEESLLCDGYTFTNQRNLPNWFVLK